MIFRGVSNHLGSFISVGRALCPLTRRNLLSARRRPATHHRHHRISPSRQRVTRAVTRRVTERADSLGWYASDSAPLQLGVVLLRDVGLEIALLVDLTPGWITPF